MRIIVVFVAFVAISVSACRSATPHTQQSRLLTNFSLDGIIKKMPNAGIELPASIPIGGSGGVAGEGEISSYRKDSTLSCQIHIEEVGFDELNFMMKLKAEVEKEITSYGAKIAGSGESNSDFHFDYRLGNINGFIDVIGIRGERNSYKLTYVMREISWK